MKEKVPGKRKWEVRRKRHDWVCKDIRKKRKRLGLLS